MSVAGACTNQLLIAPSAVRTHIITWNVTGWRCGYLTSFGYIWWWDSYNIQLNRQCSAQYGSGAYAGYTNYYNPYSWGCYL